MNVIILFLFRTILSFGRIYASLRVTEACIALLKYARIFRSKSEASFGKQAELVISINSYYFKTHVFTQRWCDIDIVVFIIKSPHLLPALAKAGLSHQ